MVKPIEGDEGCVWSITCFFVRRTHRRTGVAEALLNAAVHHSADHGATVVEGYPVEPGADRAADLYPGTVGMFRRAGFHEVRRNTPRRVVMRYTLGATSPASSRSRSPVAPARAARPPK
jgi:GNAT superfamily N-acetyltransferase